MPNEFSLIALFGMQNHIMMTYRQLLRKSGARAAGRGSLACVATRTSFAESWKPTQHATYIGSARIDSMEQVGLTSERACASNEAIVKDSANPLVTVSAGVRSSPCKWIESRLLRPDREDSIQPAGDAAISLGVRFVPVDQLDDP